MTFDVMMSNAGITVLITCILLMTAMLIGVVALSRLLGADKLSSFAIASIALIGSVSFIIWMVSSDFI